MFAVERKDQVRRVPAARSINIYFQYRGGTTYCMRKKSI
jgi:hypothetical protein